VKGADGVHLLKISETDYQLILGESKLNGDLKKGIYEAFGSLAKLIADKGKKLDFEIDLVNSQLVKESVDESSYEILKKIIIPSAKDDETYLDYSFGIFLGFDVEITKAELALSNTDFRKNIRKKIKEEIEGVVASLNYQIKKEEFVGYNFYVFIIPFSDLENKRKEIIKDIS
jgi:hypothetical protein